MKCRTDGRIDLHRKAIKQTAQSNYARQEYTCSDTMLNTHGQQQIGKIKHENAYFINHWYTFIIHCLTIGFHIPRSLGLLFVYLDSTLTHWGLGVQKTFCHFISSTAIRSDPVDPTVIAHIAWASAVDLYHAMVSGLVNSTISTCHTTYGITQSRPNTTSPPLAVQWKPLTASR